MDPQYVDFHASVATLAPVLLVAGLVAHLRFVELDDLSGDKTWDPLIPLVLSVLVAGMQIGLSLFVLAGFSDSTETLRAGQLVGLAAQVVMNLGAVLWDAMRGGR